MIKITHSGYYPGGMPLPGRQYSSDKYRFGFNGQENGNEVYGNGNLNTAQFWEYDTRLIRRWNVDPKGNEWESSYACFGNSPITNSDVFGDRAKDAKSQKVGERLTKKLDREVRKSDRIVERLKKKEDSGKELSDKELDKYEHNRMKSASLGRLSQGIKEL